MVDATQSGAQLNIRVLGDREPTLLFVHGFACALEDWSVQVDALSSEFRCVALDLPGHGASALPDTPTLATLGSAVNTAKRWSGALQVILVGHSLGAKVIREAFAQSSAEIIGLILIDGAFYSGDRQMLVERAKSLVDRAGFAAYARRHFGDMFLPTGDPAVAEAIIARALTLNPDFGRALYLEAVGWDPVSGEDTLRRLTVPVLVLQATNLDAEFKRQALQPGMRTPFMELAMRLAPQCEAKVIPESGHFPMIDAPDAVNRHIREFALRIARP